ncbi:SDR family NAD(P)-dependent oxidoreductase [Methylobacterium oxalidis]|uniref:3-oxoacyl-ACP reductase n=1 Tax=Methylobacterium oxalidis TaxID=944322 RepID=A0A512JC34_9HYPH|nr:SDR family oxidoreductase [Methylobacterium oxalidis]GEP07517.1 3-oxoacyl-ACP reductase [Methylobacterium oxalidis]GJE30751.1 3-beta-hydroxycholanate 3-dehydrogenase (NAD(+)) 1 [Methylobacterium oxalidis]GLS64265.1 3-oxoacyl-ACP reductase [Methylobacterium oxalidis]
MSTDRKVAIVTGASQGIGAGIVQAYRGLGYAVVANSRAIEGGQDPEVVTVAGDIGERAVAEQVVRTAVGRFGRVDTLINNAGIFIGKAFTDYTVEDFERALHVNVAGFFHVTQIVVPQMLEQGSGHVVQITTTLVDQPIAGAPAGLASLTKGGLAAVTRGLAIEYADRGIRVNAVAPGIIRTPMHAADALAALAKLHPMGRLGEVEDVVAAILYLEQAPFVTGEILNVDGGQHAGRW